MDPAPRRKATEADLWAIPEEERYHELIDGELIEKAAPSGEHGGAQFMLGTFIGPFHRRRGTSGLGGWWFANEVDVRLGTGDIVRPDLLGWRRERCPERPTGMPVTILPDWICEIVSPSNSKHDTIKKLRLYHRNAVPHYWLVDSREETLTVMRHLAEGYLTVLTAERGEVVRAEPFDAIELAVGTLFGDDPPDR
jgi:Uma2 family endonuclease